MKNQEVSLDEMCPCGRKNKYEDCCKMRGIIYVKKGEKVYRRIKLPKEHADEIQKMIEFRSEIYGRPAKGSELLFSLSSIYDDSSREQFVYTARKANLPKHLIYATYKCDGFMPNEDSIKYADVDLVKEYESRIKEFQKVMRNKRKKALTRLEYFYTANSFISKTIDYIFTGIKAVYNDFINRHIKDPSILNLSIKTELDYLIFVAYKNSKMITTMNKLNEENLNDAIYCLSRGVFESYLYLRNINQNLCFFAEKLYPKISNDHFEFELYSNGRVNFNKVKHGRTKETIDLRIKIYELSKSSLYSNDKTIYDIFYSAASQLAHSDILSAKDYFVEIDLYDQIEPTFLASITSLSLFVMLLLEIAENRNTKKQFKKDVNFFWLKNIGPKLIKCLYLAFGDEERPNLVIESLIKRLEEQNPQLNPFPNN